MQCASQIMSKVKKGKADAVLYRGRAGIAPFRKIQRFTSIGRYRLKRWATHIIRIMHGHLEQVLSCRSVSESSFAWESVKPDATLGLKALWGLEWPIKAIVSQPGAGFNDSGRAPRPSGTLYR